jgi:hypothetical protein
MRAFSAVLDFSVLVDDNPPSADDDQEVSL